MSIPGCDNRSVGVIVRDQQGRLLMIRRGRPPFGWACPAGHVDSDLDEDGQPQWDEAAARELREETGLRAAGLVLRHFARHENLCRRPGGDHHLWAVFEATAQGEPACDAEEVAGYRYCDQAELSRLAERTRLYIGNRMTETEWQADPGLEPIWMELLEGLGLIRSQPLELA